MTVWLVGAGEMGHQRDLAGAFIVQRGRQRRAPAQCESPTGSCRCGFQEDVEFARAGRFEFAQLLVAMNNDTQSVLAGSMPVEEKQPSSKGSAFSTHRFA